MRLLNAAKSFNQDTVLDAYSGAVLFKAQFASYDAAAMGGSFQRRRTVSTVPSSIPAERRVVAVQSIRWVMGEFQLDSYMDRPIRQSCSAKIVTGLFTLLSPAQAALRDPTGVRTIYGSAEYVRDTTNTLTSSEHDPFYNVIFGSVENVPDGYFLRSDDQYFHIRSVQIMPEGFINLACDQIALDSSAVKNCEVEVTLAGAFDPITETQGAGTSATGILMDMYRLFKYQTESVDKNTSGDMSLILSNVETLTAGQTITINGEDWRVIDFSPYLDAWNVHIRRA